MTTFEIYKKVKHVFKGIVNQGLIIINSYE